ncbi:MAG: PAS domain-containing protein, partial [Nitrospirota bacterium]|nr:PAS domain-containing protein [Nitrospirota bacterium]
MQAKNDVGRGPLTLTRAIVQPRSLPVHRELRRFGDHGLEIRSIQLALEAKLQENERWQGWVETIIENLDEGIVVSDEKGLVTLMNGQAEVILNMPRAQVLRQSLHHVWKSSGMPTVPFSSYEHRGRVLHGHEIVMQDRGPFSLGAIRILRDVTHVVEMEGQLKTRQRVAAVGEMVRCVAHEIRNKMGSIELFASLLGGTTHDDAERHRSAEQISKVIRTLDQLLSNLLVISSPPQLRIREVSVEELIQGTVQM